MEFPSMRALATRIFLPIPLVTCVLMSPVHADEMTCGALANPSGPSDYRDPTLWKYGMPQGTNHFAPEVENLQHGHAGTILGDLDYTLRSYPNHHRALWAVSRYERKLGGKLPPTVRGMYGSWRRTVECYFDRATRFTPDDSKVWMLWGMHLHASGKPKDAVEKYRKASELGEKSADFHYNRGLLLADLGEFDRALNDAHVAYSMGFPLPGLRTKLKKAGKWKDPTLQPATSAPGDKNDSPDSSQDRSSGTPAQSETGY